MVLRQTLRDEFLAGERVKYLNLGSVKLAIDRPYIDIFVLIADT